MTDRHSGYIVTLDKDIREDDAMATIMAITQIKGVISVKPIITDIEITLAHERAKQEIYDEMLGVLYKKGEI